jgi:excisionase family DNA binding protein
MSLRKYEERPQEVTSLMTVEEVATYLAVTERTIYRLVKEGRLPAYRVGGQWRFKVAVLEEWMCGPHSVESAGAARST